MTELAGMSLMPMVAGGQLPVERVLFWEHMGNRAVSVGELKLVADYSRPWELYDLDADRTELSDLARKFPETVAAMDKRYLEWARKVGVEDFDEIRKRNRSRGD